MRNTPALAASAGSMESIPGSLMRKVPPLRIFGVALVPPAPANVAVRSSPTPRANAPPVQRTRRLVQIPFTSFSELHRVPFATWVQGVAAARGHRELAARRRLTCGPCWPSAAQGVACDADLEDARASPGRPSNPPGG